MVNKSRHLENHNMNQYDFIEYSNDPDREPDWLVISCLACFLVFFIIFKITQS